MTGLKIVLVTNSNNTEGSALLKNVYEIYSDFVSKDPFYTVFEIYIKICLFNLKNELAWSTDSKSDIW